MTTYRLQRAWAVPIRTARDIAVMALGVVVATWPLIALFVLVRALL